MGIRVHKLLGYGLTDLQHDEKNGWKITDPRINPQGVLGLDWEEREEKFSRKNYAKWLRERYEACGDYNGDKLDLAFDMVEADHSHKNSTKKCEDPCQCFIHQGEYGMPNVLAVMPYVCRWGNDWYRYDTMIDYMEESRGSQGNRVVVYEDCLYPWIQYWDVRTGELKKSDVACAYRRLVNAERDEKKSRKRKKQSYTESKTSLAQLMGFDSLEDCEQFLHPAVPRCVQLLCEFCEVFTIPSMVRDLRPMLYVYWS